MLRIPFTEVTVVGGRIPVGPVVKGPWPLRRGFMIWGEVAGKAFQRTFLLFDLMSLMMPLDRPMYLTPPDPSLIYQ